MGWRKKNRGRGRENINSSCTGPETARGQLHERLSPSGKGHSTKDADFAVAGRCGQQGAVGATRLCEEKWQSRSRYLSWCSKPGITKGTWISMKNVSTAPACLSAASNLPCRDSSGSVAWILFLVPVECWSWSQDLAAHRQELQLQGLQAWPPGTWRSIRSLSNFQSISYFERCFQKASSQQPLP